jgi:hypothetical protein
MNRFLLYIALAGLCKDVAASCVYDWRMPGGNNERQAHACFRRNTPPSDQGAPFSLLPSSALYQKTVAVSSTVDFAVIQTSQLDLIAFNTTTGSVLWATYNTTWTSAQTATAGARAGDSAVPGDGEGDNGDDDDPGPEPGRGPPMPGYIVSGALDEARGLLLVQDTSSLYALRMSNGDMVWTIGLDGHDDVPAWGGVAGAALGMMVLPPPAGAAERQPLQALMLVDVYSNVRGVVAANWLVSIALDNPRVLWVQPIVIGNRSTCRWPLALTNSGEDRITAFLTCDTAVFAQITRDTSVFAISFPSNPPTDPSPPVPSYNATQLWRTLLPANASTVTQLTYFTGAVYDAASSQVIVGSSLPGQPGLYKLDAGSGAVTAFLPQAAAKGTASANTPAACARGWTGGNLVFLQASSTEAAVVSGLTPDGELAAVDVATGALLWCVAPQMPPIATYSNYGRYQTSNPVFVQGISDAQSSIWWTWSNNNRSSGLVGVQVEGKGSSIVYAGWPQPSGPATSGIGSAAALAFDIIPVQVVSRTSSIRTLLLGSTQVPFLADVTVPSSGDRGVSGADVTPFAEVSSLGAVYSSPIIITQQGNPSNAVMVYVGADDDRLRVFNISSSDGQLRASLLWSLSTSDAWGALDVVRCTGTWPAATSSALPLLVCLGTFGDINIMHLLSGGPPATPPRRTSLALRTFLQLDPFSPTYAGEGVLVDDPSSPSGVSMLMSTLAFPFLKPSSLALVRLPMPIDGGETLPVPESASYVAWNVTCDVDGVQQSFYRFLRVTTTSLAGPAQALALTAVSGYTGEVRAYDAKTGAKVWASMLAPTNPSGWLIRSIIYDSASELVIIAFTYPRSIHPDEDVGCVAAAKASSGELVWRTPDLCIIANDGLASDGQRVYVTCANAGPYGLPGKIAMLSIWQGGSVVGWAGVADDAMASGPSLMSASNGTDDACNDSEGVVVFGAAGGAISLSSATTGTPVGVSLSLPYAATAVDFEELNINPAFTDRVTIDADGVLYAAAGDDRGAYMVVVQGFTGNRSCGQPTPLPSPSSGPAGPGAASPTDNTVVVAAAAPIAAVLAAAMAGVWWFKRRRGAMQRPGGGVLLQDAYSVLQQELSSDASPA